MLAARLYELLAMMMIGDGLLSVLSPKGHVAVWRDGPRWWQRTIEPFERRPNLTRTLGLVGLGLGLWLAFEQQPAPPRFRRVRNRLKRQVRRWPARVREMAR